MLDIAVLLGDPRLPYRYNLSNRFEQQDYDALSNLRQALRSLNGYRFRFLDDHESMWRHLEDIPPALVLNFCNTGYRNNPSRQHHVPAMLEVLNIPYAGAGPESIVLCHHKFLVYALATHVGVPVPQHVLAQTTQPEACHHALYPAFIKPNDGDGSFGIDIDAVAQNPEEAQRCLRDLDAFAPGQSVLIQEYLRGPEYSVGVIGSPEGGYTVLPPLQIDFSSLEASLPPIMTYRSKVDPESPYWKKVRFLQAEPDAVSDKIMRYAGLLFDALGCRDYARMDFRCGVDGEPRLLDVNAHPMWGEGGMLPTVASYRGDTYPQFLESIIKACRARLQL